MSTSSVWKHRLLILRRLVLKKWYLVLGTWNIKLQPGESFCIKAGYHHAVSAEAFDDRSSKDEFQRSVYELAGSFAFEFEGSSFLDVGCGSGYKLIHMLGQYNTIGIEVEPAYSWLLQKYPDRQWILFDSGSTYSLQADIVICSDVIEHIRNPNEIMNFLAGINFTYLILSTPERDTICGKKDYGPPENTSHYREWNVDEFKMYVSHWFTILEHHIVKDKSVSQLVVCTKK